MKLIPNKLTKMSALDVLNAFRAAITKITGTAPANSTLAILVAQSALECGRWASMHCYNFGNIRPPAGWTGGYCQFRCNEKIKGEWVWFDPPSPGSNFVAFESAEDGAEFYIRKLIEKWPEAWDAAMHGNATRFVHGLKQRGYFTADEAPYQVAVYHLYKEFFGYLSTGAESPAHEPDMTSVQAIVASPVVIAPALLAGAQGEAVNVWQHAIGVPQTGDFDDSTVEATKAWQRGHGLPVTGVVCEADLIAAGLAPTPPETA